MNVIQPHKPNNGVHKNVLSEVKVNIGQVQKDSYNCSVPIGDLLDYKMHVDKRSLMTSR